MHPYHPLPAGENAPRESFSSQTIEDHGSELDHEGRPLVKGAPHKISPGDGDSSLDNPLADYTHAELIELGTRFAKDKKLMNLTFVKEGKKIKFGGREDLTEDVSDDFMDDSEPTLGLWAKAALLARDPAAFEHIEGLNDDDRGVLRHEVQHKWSHPWELYKMVAMSSMAAAVSGMDESVISGAQLFYPRQFGIDSGTGRDGWIVGLVNAAPYLCCSLIGCWLTEPLNNAFGRRGAIFISAVICCVTCIWAAFTGSWWHLFIARFFLGLGIGPKSGTVPIYTAECSPTPIRGALVMMWQMWTAFGIMLGYVADLSFYKIADTPSIVGLNWRLMLGAAGFPAFLVAIQVWFSPESPRWLMAKGRYEEAYRAMYRLRGHELLAARDIFFIHVMLQEEEAVVDQSGNRWLELFTVPRVRRATLASSIVMFGQNAGGIGAVVYYCSTIFTQAGFSETAALTASWGFGVTNWLFALPAVYTIDTFGRRSLLLSTFPLMAIFLCVVGLAFFMNEANPSRIWVIASGIYAYAIVYSSGSGPVPFVLSAEVFPIAHREIGMSWATSVCWGFNFIVAITFPSLLDAYKPQGAFGWYATWNVVLWVLVLLFVPETKGLSLEELDMVFSVPTKKHASYSLKSIPWFIRRHILGQDVHQEPLYAFNSVESRATYGAKNEGGPTDRRRR